MRGEGNPGGTSALDLSTWVPFPRFALNAQSSPGMTAELKRPHVRQMASHRSSSGHRRRYQMRAPAAALAALEIAVGGGGAALTFLQPVCIHRQAHGTARI